MFTIKGHGPGINKEDYIYILTRHTPIPVIEISVLINGHSGGQYWLEITDTSVSVSNETM